jgi:formamidase
MPETLIKVDLSKSAYDNDMIHNRWHPDIPMVSWVNPGDDFIIETYDWTGGFIKNNDSADDVRDIDLSIVHFLSGPIGVKGAEPGDLLVVDLRSVRCGKPGASTAFPQWRRHTGSAPLARSHI